MIIILMWFENKTKIYPKKLGFATKCDTKG